jgi:predicted metal-dependent peptidase
MKANPFKTETRATTFSPAALKPEQRRMWTETRAAFLWSCPAFSHILYTMLNPHQSEEIASFTTDVPIAATDGTQLLLNPDTFFKHSLNERVFIVAHEIMHCVYDHCGQHHLMAKRGSVVTSNGKSYPYDGQTMNMALDYVVNDLLVRSNVGQYNKAWLHDPKIANADDSAIDAYAKIYKDDGGGGGDGDEGDSAPATNHKGQSSFDQHLAPPTTPNGNTQQRNDVEWKQAVTAGAAAAKAQGKLPAALEKAFGALLHPEVSWSERIEAFFARRLGVGSYDWRRPDRRMTMYDHFSPSPSGHGCDTVVVAVDTSGSIAADPTIIDRFFAELSGIVSDVNPRRVLAIWCDATVHRVDELTDAADLNDVRSKKIPGWGGTDFNPVFDYLSEHNITPDALVYLTDGFGNFPKSAPAYPVLWGAIDKDVRYPFGEVVHIPV